MAISFNQCNKFWTCYLHLPNILKKNKILSAYALLLQDDYTFTHCTFLRIIIGVWTDYFLECLLIGIVVGILLRLYFRGLEK